MKRDRTAPLVLAVAACLAAGGCNALLGLGEEPDGQEPAGGSSVASTGAGPSSSGSTSSSSAGSTSNGPSSSGSASGGGGAADGGGGSGAGGDASAATGSGGAGGAGGAPDLCDPDPAPVDFGCGACTLGVNGCAKCDAAQMRCTRRFIFVPNTSRRGEAGELATIAGRFGRGLAVQSGVIAFSRVNDPPGDGKEEQAYGVVTVVRRNWGFNDTKPSVNTHLATIAGGPAPANEEEPLIIVTTAQGDNPVEVRRLIAQQEDQPLLPLINLQLPQGGFGALAWDTGPFFVAVGRNDLAFYRFNALGLIAPCSLGDSGLDAAGIGLARSSFGGGDAWLTIPAGEGTGTAFHVPATSCSSPAPAVSTLDSDEAIIQANGIAAACGRAYVQAIARNEDNVPAGRAFRVDAPSLSAPTYPSQAIAASGDRVYIPSLAGGVARCAPSLGDSCTLVSDAESAGKVSLIAVTRQGFVSVGFADDAFPTSSAVVTCADEEVIDP